MSLPYHPQPKPEKRSTTKRRADAAHSVDVTAVRGKVFVREHFRCRIPWCKQLVQLEWAHLEARGMGGNDSKDTTANTVCACKWCHQGPKSMHSGHIQYRFLSTRGADGPMAWELCEELPTAVKS